ncbi:MAG TPA: oligoendopeptidase F [Armatimonadota bacterium]|nr:oligoendopeptidase F [Armatimonadota bacterium]
MKERTARSDVPVNETWNLEDLYTTMEEWEADFARVEREIPSVTEFKDRLGEHPRSLLGCLEASEALRQRFIRVSTYASLLLSGDGTSSANQALASRVGSLAARLSADTSFIRSEILLLPEGVIKKYLAQEPALDDFMAYLEELEEYRDHTLLPETENALAALGEALYAPAMIYNRAKISDMRFDAITDEAGESVPMSFALYEDHFELSPNTTLRRRGWVSFSQGLNGFKNCFAAALSTEIKRNVATARLRKYDSAEAMLLHPQRVSIDVYHNVLDIIQTELAPHMRRYQRLRMRVLGLNKLLHCDLKAPLDPDFNPAVTYEEASNIILDGLGVLGPDYAAIMRRALTERWVDLADNVGKSTGAFCSSPYGIHPYILITWTNTMRGTFVLAHELGHAGHFATAQQYQRLTNMRPSMFFVEAPSTCNELILGSHVLAKSTDPRMRRWVILQLMGTFHHNFVTHLLEGELQRRLYALAESNKPITAVTLCDLKGEILAGFFGDTLDVDDGARLTWMRQPHYYMGLYPYTYAAGLTVSCAVAEAIRSEGQPAVDRWLAALRAGGTLPPLELMWLAGVDMSRPEPIRGAVAYVGKLVDELEKSFEG